MAKLTELQTIALREALEQLEEAKKQWLSLAWEKDENKRGRLSGEALGPYTKGVDFVKAVLKDSYGNE